ncbi:NAD(P)/FAD-dependent oxidoreductase [Herbaspirillum autotrophicum]|uniref:NAD(P)/FAD-dependent oxidoreductase n=1 Tax=Herbaspirillum autotrophicum TaxID=180195 RepID=UPI00067E15A3|nr:NAD(P)/FAD-dependent oxidoreductase [Herbaspirillum autotrophicum]
MTTQATCDFDVIVIGGSYAGLSAALQLARTRRRILMIDGGVRRNRFAATSHGFLGQDGRAPDAIAADGRRQLQAYPNVQWLDDTAANAVKSDTAFAVSTAGGHTVHGARLVLATGVVDELPAIDGLAERWGQSVFHCPYCHGYELNAGQIGVLATGPMSLHHATLLPDWGQVTLFTNGALVLDETQHADLRKRGVHIEITPVARISNTATVELQDGRRLTMAGLFTLSRTHMASPLAQQLGCDFEEGPLGAFIKTEMTKETSVSGVFACGDAARMAGSVALAVGDGAMAGVGAHQSLLFR